MKTTQWLKKWQLTILTLVCILGIAQSSWAVLRDFGPLNFGGYPTWYRDNTGVAVQQCLSKAVSPVSALPSATSWHSRTRQPPFNPALPITFYPNPVAGYNWPLETFYYSLRPILLA